MTNQEAREILVGLEAAYRDLDPLAFTYDGIQLLNERIEAVRAAISALEKQDVPDTNVGDTISRQAAIDCFWNKERYFRDALDVIKDIRQLPSAQPEVIRCKDCKYYKLFKYDGVFACHYVIGAIVQRNSDDFCSRAKRRTDGD